MRPLAAVARASGLLMLLVVLFLASITGYLGPSYVSLDPMNFRRFQVLHYGVWPAWLLRSWFGGTIAQERNLPTSQCQL